MCDLPSKVGAPPAEIIVHINDRHAHLLRALFQPQTFSRHRPCVTEKLVRFRKIEIVDDVDQKQRHVRFVRRAAMQIWVSRRHDNETGGPVCRPFPTLRLAQRFFFPPDFFPPFFPPLREDALLLFFPRPEPLFLPPCPTCSQSPRRG